ncbi:hypothetical protein [Streptomyces flavalbus]|uniref:Uncharacterized protein n=1 Tax=Streptomyces flavalbus TaxID=2665155 RepID=A0ABW2WLU9_9ACTN
MITGGLVVAGPASAAHATAADCSGGARGFTDIPDNLTGTAVNGSAVVNSWGDAAHFAQHWGYVNGVKMGWGYLSASTLSGGIRTHLWMDVSNDGGDNWIQCGPFEMWGNGTRTTAAYPTSTSSSRKFRVCASILGNPNQISCHAWW